METVYVLSALSGILSVAALYLIVNSRFGLGLAAIRDNQRNAQASDQRICLEAQILRSKRLNSLCCRKYLLPLPEAI